MVVCKYYIKGDCRFGDRCRFEHPRGGSGGGYGGGGYQSYGGGASFGTGHTGNYGNYGQQQSNYKNPYVYHKDPSGGRNYDGRGQGGGGGGGGGETKKVVFRDSFGSFGGNQNQLTNLHHQTPNDDIKDQDILDAINHDVQEWEGSRIWPLSSYKPNKSRCTCLPGFDDISPEEVRFLAYTAEKENKFDQHKASFASALSTYKRQRDTLRAPSRDMKAQLINAFRGGHTSGSIFGNAESAVQILYSTLPGGSGQAFGAPPFGSTSSGFGSMSSANSAGFGGGTFGSSQSGNLGAAFGTRGPSGHGASPGLFGKPASIGTGSFGKQAAQGAETGLFRSTPGGTTGTGLFGKPVAAVTNDSGGSGGMFGGSGSAGQTSLFGKPATFGSSPSGSSGLTQGDFGSSPSATSGSASGSHRSTYTPQSELTPEEKEQFEAASFSLGKVPTRPPPIELCR